MTTYICLVLLCAPTLLLVSIGAVNARPALVVGLLAIAVVVWLDRRIR